MTVVNTQMFAALDSLARPATPRLRVEPLDLLQALDQPFPPDCLDLKTGDTYLHPADRQALLTCLSRYGVEMAASASVDALFAVWHLLTTEYLPWIRQAARTPLVPLPAAWQRQPLRQQYVLAVARQDLPQARRLAQALCLVLG